MTLEPDRAQPSRSGEPVTTALDRALFLGRWLRRPRRVGSITPSSQALGKAMAAVALDGLPADHLVIELGAGTGSITRALLSAGLAAERLVPVELDPELHVHLTRAFPSLRLLNGDAAQLPQLLADHGIARVGAVVSSLPLLAMPGRVVEAVVSAAISVLPAGRPLVQFTYGTASPVPADLARRLDLEAARIRRVWSNLPPAVVWRFTRPA